MCRFRCLTCVIYDIKTITNSKMVYVSTHHVAEKCNKICMVVAGLVPVNVKNWHNCAVNIVAMDVMEDYMEQHILLQSKSSSCPCFRNGNHHLYDYQMGRVLLSWTQQQDCTWLALWDTSSLATTVKSVIGTLMLFVFTNCWELFKVSMSLNRVTHLDQGDKNWIISAKCYASLEMKKIKTGIILINSC